MERNVVITGIGLVLPQIQSLEDLWNLQLDETARIEPLSDRVAGSRINPDEISKRLPPRLSKKLDVFTKYALIATEAALADADLDLDETDTERCGVFVGNCFGGWQFTEKELRNLHLAGPRAVSPFQATSWFPAAPQGQITIKYGLKGFSKTFMADRMSSVVSIAAAASKIRSGILDVAIAGGTESTNTDMVRTGLEMIPTANGEDDSEFDLSEGSVFVILEDEDLARARGARIYARVGEFSSVNSPCAADVYPKNRNSYVRVMREAIGNEKPDVVLSDACGLAECDASERDAIGQVLPNATIMHPKDRLGHSFGAEGALDISMACLMLHKSEMMPKSDSTDNHSKINSILVNTAAMGGGLASLVLQKGDTQ